MPQARWFSTINNRRNKSAYQLRCDRSFTLLTGDLTYHPLHDAGTDAELLAYLENAITVGLQFQYTRLYRGLIRRRPGFTPFAFARASQAEKTAAREPLSRVDRKALIAGRDRRAATPSQAKNFLSTMRGMLIWAVDSNLVAPDPTQNIKNKKSRQAKAGGFPVWTDEEIAAFERRWPRGTRERVMFDLFLYTGLRRGDAAVVGRQHVRNGVISIQTEKTGMWVHIPILPQLAATLEAGPTGDLAFIASTAGNPMAKESLGNLFAEACRAAGVRKSAHGLRKAAATNAANHGATVAELEAIFGWQGGQMASLYTRSANRRALSAGAMTKLARTETETSIPSPPHEVRAPERKG